ncbi:MAG: hypothetical protein ACYTG3_21545 [Planctomycetota bacterium]
MAAVAVQPRRTLVPSMLACAFPAAWIGHNCYTIGPTPPDVLVVLFLPGGWLGGRFVRWIACWVGLR